MTTKNRLRRRIEQALYSLSREYGGTIHVYKLVGSDTDTRTGVTTVQKTVHTIPRAIILPGTLARREIRGISVISANKQLVQGGHWESADRIFIIRDRDLPFTPSTDEWIVYESDKYRIDKLQFFEFDAGTVLWGKAVEGDTPQQIFHRRTENWMHLEGVADVEP